MAISIRDRSSPFETYQFQSYDVFFFNDSISTTVTANPDKVTEWISGVVSSHGHLPRLIVGLDVEWRPSFTPGQNNQNPAATLQLCVGDRCLIFQIIHSPYPPPSLADFLSDYSNTFVGVAIKNDLQKLQRDYGIGGNAHCVDLARLAADAYLRNDFKTVGLKTLASLVLGKEVEKPQRVRTSRWDERWLTAEQVQYACVDAFLSYKIGRTLNASYFY